MEFQPMTPEEMQRTMQFLLTQQAQFAADLERLTNRTSIITDAVMGLTGIVGRLAERQEQTDQQMREMRAELQAQAQATDSRFNQLGEHIDRVESHLDVVIEMFERHLREDHGQRPS